LQLGSILSGSSQIPVTGHALVIEFWATWCRPCRDAIPHWNELASQFQNRDIDFLSLTSEGQDIVRPFLRDHLISGTVALDPDNRTADAFGPFNGIPDTVLLDETGVLIAIIRPSELNRDVLEGLLAHRPLHLAISDARVMKREPVHPGEPVNDADALARVVIRRVVASPTIEWSSDDRFDSPAVRLKSLLSIAYGIPQLHIELPPYLEGDYYSVQAWVPPSRAETLKPMMQAAIAASAGIRVRHEERQDDVLVITGFPGKLARSSTGMNQGGSRRPGSISGDLTAGQIRQYIEAAAKRTIALDDAPTGIFTINPEWDPANPSALESALRTQLGLELKAARRAFPFLVVESLDAVRQ
jgi:uncharacterized protein (TIGR03435 family)